MTKKPVFIFINAGQDGLLKKTYRVVCNGKEIGSVIYFWISHLERIGWEAIGADGHRAVHETRLQAAKALLWDGKGYPFPIAKA